MDPVGWTAGKLGLHCRATCLCGQWAGAAYHALCLRLGAASQAWALCAPPRLLPAAFLEWYTTYLLIAGEDKLLRKDDVRGTLDGTLFYKCAQGCAVLGWGVVGLCSCCAGAGPVRNMRGGGATASSAPVGNLVPRSSPGVEGCCAACPLPTFPRRVAKARETMRAEAARARRKEE